MMTYNEACRILELPSSPTREQVHEAYRVFSKVWHPDRFPDGSDVQKKAERRQREINEAYDFLKNNFREQATGSDQQESEQQTESDGPELISFDAVYVGNDPRILLKKVPCKVALGKEFLAIAFNEDDYAIYRGSEVRAVRRGNAQTFSRASTNSVRINDNDEDRVTLLLDDPEQIVDHIVLELRFPNDYFAKLFMKKVCDYFGLMPFIKPKPKPVNSEFTKMKAETNQDRKLLVVTVGTGLGIIVLSVIFIGYAYKTKQDKLELTHSRVLSLDATEKAIPSEAGNFKLVNSQPVTSVEDSIENLSVKEESDGGFQPPQDARIFSKGSFTVWLEPHVSGPGAAYNLMIVVRLPTYIARYSANDLSGTVYGRRNYRRTFPDPIFPPWREIDLPILDHTAQMIVIIPRDVAKAPFQIEIRSSRLNEKQTIDVEF